tara:strand:- start:44 stop:721 length:678 start_codon:yes stop_codon:yes gene_type:complete
MENYRYEIKFILNEANYSNAYFIINAKTSMKKDFSNRVVNSLYFDDMNFSSVQDNLIGLANRKKMRLRWYDNNLLDKRAIFEIKKRNGRLGSKDTFKIDSLYGSLMDLKINEVSNLITKDLLNKEIVLSEYLQSTLQVSYERQYYKNFEDIRVTIDRNIGFSYPMLQQKMTPNMQLLYPYSILEVKFDPKDKSAAFSIIKSLGLTPKRHSKYLAGMAAFGLANYI